MAMPDVISHILGLLRPCLAVTPPESLLAIVCALLLYKLSVVASSSGVYSYTS